MNKNQDLIGKIFNTNRDGQVKVLEVKPKGVLVVEFLNSGYTREVSLHNLKKGKCADHSIEFRKKEVIVERPMTIHSSNTFGDFILLEKCGNKATIQFYNTGYTRVVEYANATAGKVRDPYAKNTYGIAYLGEYSEVPYVKQAMQLWRNMVKRCYSETDTKGYFGKGVTVDDRWLCFANFLEDLPKLENFDLWLIGQNEGCTKYNLDKDFKIRDNKVYSREACMFLTDSFNKSITSRTKNKEWMLPNE